MRHLMRNWQIILRTKKSYTDRLSELTVRCLRLLLERGWRNAIAIDLAKQLLILLTLMVGGLPENNKKQVPEEIAVEALRGLEALFRAISRTPGASKAITDVSTIPAVGHCVTTILDTITDGPSAGIQIQGLKALTSVWTCIKDVQAQANFLPGTVSALTKCLMPSTSSRRTQKTLITALDTLQLVLTTVLSDFQTRNIRAKSKLQTEPEVDEKSAGLTQSWLTATASQIKLALANIVKLRTQKSDDVRLVLNRFCITLLDECHDTLVDSTSMLVEACLSLTDVEGSANTGMTSIADLAAIHSNIGECVKKTFYHWASSLPRVLQMNDETAKAAALHQLSAAYQLLGTLNLSTSLLDDTLSQSLKDSISSIVELSSSPKLLQETSTDFSSQSVTTLATQGTSVMKSFRPILLKEESQKSTRVEMSKFLSCLATSRSGMVMANEMLDYMRGASGSSLLAAYWISFQLVENAATNNDELDEFLESSLLLPEGFESTVQELYSYSLATLSDDDGDTDWRMKAIALEFVSRSAQRSGKDFRGELVDILYPVSQLLGSSNHELRERATICLNILSESCGYPSVRELIVENVDYMVNAVSLRLNTFDISPQAPQVLIMMIRLTGPSLLPYLDDVVTSTFAALDNFHGYQDLVESLFSVLGEIVETGAQSQQLQLADTPATGGTENGKNPTTLSSIIETIHKQQQRANLASSLEHEDFPHKPWKDAAALLDNRDASPTEEEADPTTNAMEIEKPPPTKTYLMLQSIARLSQHHLTNPSPALRTRLLTLIRTSSSALHHNPEAFLPLVNDIWPVVIERLHDRESFVAIAAADALANLCRCAGNFLTTRFAVQWARVMGLARRARRDMLAEKTGSGGGRGMYSQAAQMWESVVGLLSAVVEFVGVNDEAFDDVLEILSDVVRERADVRDALSTANADAVWLLLLQAGGLQHVETPVLEGYQFLPLDRAIEI
ncbi:heat repeat protein [Rutstroemia sp. NJR-2017a BBW]|nr:heat repeat protein [Rutstroemia sp. NJR-2017a BBW]